MIKWDVVRNIILGIVILFIVVWLVGNGGDIAEAILAAIAIILWGIIFPYMIDDLIKDGDYFVRGGLQQKYDRFWIMYYCIPPVIFSLYGIL